MASAKSFPLRNTSPADTPLPESPLPRTAALVDTNTGTSETFLEKLPSTDKMTTVGDPPARIVRVKSRSPTCPDSPSMAPRQPHPYHYPPSPLQTPPSTAIHPGYYQQTPQAPPHYLPTRPLHNYTSPRSEYGSQYASSTNGHQQPRRSFSAQRYQSGGGVMNTPEHSHPLRRLSSQGYPPIYPMSASGSTYGYEDAADDNPVYSGQSISGTLFPSAAYDADPHSNIEGLIQRAQGALQSLTMPIPSLQHLCDRYRAVNDELERFQQIADEQEKDMRELQVKKGEMEAARINLEQNLELSTADIEHLKTELSNLEAEVQRLSDIVEEKDEEKRDLERRLTLEKEALAVEFKNWKRDVSEAHEAERRSIFTSHGEEKKIMEAKFLSEKRSIEASHSADKMLIVEMHSASSRELEAKHADALRRLKDSHKDELAAAQKTHKSIVSSLEKSLRGDLEQLRAEFSTERSDIQAVFDSEKKRLEESFARQKASLEDSFTHERNSMETDFASQKRNMEERFSSQKRAAELQFKMESEDLRQICETEKLEMQKAFETAKTKWLQQEQKILTRFDQEKSTLDQVIRTLEEEKRALENANQSLSVDKSTLQDTVATLEDDKVSLISEAERQKLEWEAQKQKLEVEVKNLENMRDSLKKEVRGLRDVIKRTAEEEEGEERKSRGDGYYIDAFTKLSKDIIDISKEFSDLPVPPSGRVLAELPSGLPCMLANTDASRLIRMAYVQHIISKYLCHRIFQPFLFYLGKRYDKADSFFQSMSKQLREKSTRKEAIWRYYTLLAGYTASNAKRTASVAATNVIEEIAGHVKPFADQNRMEVITSGISRIVKFAIETWRHARVEREIFTASMSLDVSNENSWIGHLYEQEKPYADNPTLVGQLRSLRCRHEIILPLLPIFSREGTLPSLHRPGASLDDGFVFSKGIALYMDSLPALQRSIETSPLGSVPALPIDAELVTTQGKEPLSPAPEGEDEDKTTAADKEAKEKALKEQADIRAKEEAERQVKEEAEAMVRREEERVAKEEAERLATENAEREARVAADRAAAEEIQRAAVELAEKEAADRLQVEEREADLAHQAELARLDIEAHKERQDLENLDYKHQAEAGNETTGSDEKTSAETTLADNESWGDEDTEIEKVIQQALMKTQTAEDESFSTIDPHSVDRFMASSKPGTVSPDQDIATLSVTGETEQTDDTVETALEQQSEDVTVPSNTAYSASLPQAPPSSEGNKVATKDNTESVIEAATEEGEIIITDSAIQNTEQAGSTEGLQEAVESEATTLPAAELGSVPPVFQPEGESLLDDVTAETPQEATTDSPVPEPPIIEIMETNDKAEVDPAEAVTEAIEEPSSETLLENPEVPSANAPIEVDINTITSPVSDVTPVSVPDMAEDTDIPTPAETLIDDLLNGSTFEISALEDDSIKHPTLPDLNTKSKEGSTSIKEPVAQDLLAKKAEIIESATEDSINENLTTEESVDEVSKLTDLLVKELEATEDIEVESQVTEPIAETKEPKDDVPETELKDSETEEPVAPVAESKAEESKLEEQTPEESKIQDSTVEKLNAQEPTTDKQVAEVSEPKPAIQEPETVIAEPKSEATKPTDKPEQPKAVEPPSEAEEPKLQSEDPTPKTEDLKPEAEEEKPKPSSPFFGMPMGFGKSSFSDNKNRGPSPGSMLFSNLRHSASMSEKRDPPSSPIGEAKLEKTLPVDSNKLDTPELSPSTPTSSSPEPEEPLTPTTPTKPATPESPSKSKRKKRKGKHASR